MRPIILRMTAFGPYADTVELDFRVLGNRGFFLIHGPTGSGKTSILDAFCFALYGRCSGGDRPADSTRCQYAADHVRTEVMLEFKLQGERYRVRRTPRQEKPKRGGGTIIAEPTVLVERVTHLPIGAADDGEVLATRLREADQIVQELLGFSVDQFRQVMVLPQGEFRKLLTSPSNERTDILETLFRTHVYTRIQEALDHRAKELRSDAVRITERLAAFLSGADVETEEQLGRRIEERANQLDAEGLLCEEAGKAERQASKTLEEARDLDQQFEEAGKARAALIKLEAGVDASKQKETRLERARSAQLLGQVDTTRRRAAADAGKAAQHHQAAIENAKTAQDCAKRAKERFEKEQQRESDRVAARRDLLRLEELHEPLKQLDTARGAEKRLLASISEHRLEQDRHVELLNAKKNDLASLDEGIREAEPIAAQADSIRARTQELERLQKLAAKRETDDRRHASLVKDQETGAGRLRAHAEALASAKASRLQLEEDWRANQALILAADLEDGKPCPVCGSVHHPAPAISDVKPPTAEAIDAAREHEESVANELNTMREAAENANNQVAACTATLREIREQLGDAADRTAREIAADLKQVQTSLKDAEAATKRLQAARRDRETLETQIAAASRDIEARQKTLQEIEKRATEATTRRVELERRVPKDITSLDALKRQIGIVEKRRDDLEKALEDARTASNSASEKLATATAELDAAMKSAAETSHQAEAAAADFAGKLKAAGFSDEADFATAQRDVPSIAALEKEITAFGKDLHTARERAKTTSAAIAGKARPDIAALEAASQSARDALREVSERRQTLAVHLQTDRRTLEQIEKTNREGAALREEHEAVAVLAGVANGRRDENPLMMKFQQYVLAALLDDVLASASRRLAILSKSRYLLRRVTDPTTGRRSTALDLEVEDSFTGFSRPVQTLSGGESFLASLSLALGLADVVQNYAGGIELGTLFIDEGFGTLDDQSLDEAIRVLLDLQKGSKLVGIISHVRELRDCIDVRLEIAPGPRGSTARFLVP